MIDPVTAIALIGGGFIAIKAFGNKNETTGEQAEQEPAFDTGPNVGANADEIGYERINQAQYNAQGGVEAGQVATVQNESGQIVGTVVGTEGGNQVFQEAGGTVHIRSAGEPEIEPVTPTAIQTAPAPAQRPGTIMTAPATRVTRDHRAAANVPKLTVKKPKKAVSNALLDKRIRAAARAGFRIPM